MLRQFLLFGPAQDEVTNAKVPTRNGKRRRVRGWRHGRGAGVGLGADVERMAASHRVPVKEAPGVAVCAVPSSVLDAIRAINPLVDVDYLARFDESALRLYLAHLESSRLPRGRGARWERPGDTRAIRMCRPPEEA